MSVNGCFFMLQSWLVGWLVGRAGHLRDPRSPVLCLPLQLMVVERLLHVGLLLCIPLVHCWMLAADQQLQFLVQSLFCRLALNSLELLVHLLDRGVGIWDLEKGAEERGRSSKRRASTLVLGREGKRN